MHTKTVKVEMTDTQQASTLHVTMFQTRPSQAGVLLAGGESERDNEGQEFETYSAEMRVPTTAYNAIVPKFLKKSFFFRVNPAANTIGGRSP